MRETTTSVARFARAQRSLAGGVSSDARRTTGVPLYVDRAAGAHLWDVDGNEYIDYVLGQGPGLLGHCPEPVVRAVQDQVARGIAYSAQHEAEIEAAELLCKLVPSAEKVRFNSVGSEAAHAALRLARAHTGRRTVLKFEGHYHGWLDPVLYSVHPPLSAAGPHAAPNAVPGTNGQPALADGSLVICPWNDPDVFTALVARHADNLAAVIMEPLMCNSGCIAPAPGFLELVRRTCTDIGAVLVFDEIITGFRLAAGGAQEFFGVTPDLTVLGKALASGMQVSALAGRASVMDDISEGRVAHAGTFNSQPVAIAAAVATLRILDEQRDEIYPRLHARGTALKELLLDEAKRAGVPMTASGPGSVFQTYFTDRSAVTDYRQFAAVDHARASAVHLGLLDAGVNTVARGLWFLSTAHTDDDVARTAERFGQVLKAVDAASAS